MTVQSFYTDKVLYKTTPVKGESMKKAIIITIATFFVTGAWADSTEINRAGELIIPQSVSKRVLKKRIAVFAKNISLDCDFQCAAKNQDFKISSVSHKKPTSLNYGIDDDLLAINIEVKGKCVDSPKKRLVSLRSK